MIKKLALVLLLATTSAAMAATYPGNGATGFGGPVGNGTLTLTDNGTTLTGTVTAGGAGTLPDDLVIYIDSKAGGFTNTSTFTDTGGGGDTLRKAISGFNGTLRSTVNFAAGFDADFAIGISPANANFGALFTLDNVANFTYGTDGTNGNANLTPTGNVAGPFTFTISLASLGIAPGGSFDIATTYGNFHSDVFRSNEAFGNTVTDVTNPANTGNIGQDTAALGFSTYTASAVPEPATILLLGPALLGGMFFVRRRRA
jgi:hypothetical protein